MPSIREPRPQLIPVAQYVRMSTDYQRYSIENQSIANHAYAAQRGMEIVRTYSDSGRSGLTLRGRPSLKRLISDIQTNDVNFRAVLVYDVSRWGRFQDTDEGGSYEYACKRAGIPIHYCAELFENDEGLFTAVVKSLKRAMAAEYSRELSVKSFAGQARIFDLGFRTGSSPAHGTKRLLVDQTGRQKCILTAGQYKSLQSDRVITISGPPEEIRTVKWIASLAVSVAQPKAIGMLCRRKMT
jgi:DNA invertase Pin-like site-specific DNA recombinase